MRRFVRENSLTLFFGAIFLLALIGQAIAGHAAFNNEQLAHGEETVSLGRYVTSSEFGRAVMENWQSEYLQFMLMMLATVWLVQRGSPESKELEKAGRESKRDQKIEEAADERSPFWARAGGWRTALYSNSLLIVMATIFFGSWFAQSVTGLTEFNDAQRVHGEATLSWLAYLGSAEFWEATLENWQSEFLAVGSFAAFTIFLRQRGSPESKPVGAPHDATGVQG
jgi:Arc/MetJ-type ribon-helix-helix transcriptional regulator